jgi:hypothetical protein
MTSLGPFTEMELLVFLSASVSLRPLSFRCARVAGQAPKICSETERVRGPSSSARMILCQAPRITRPLRTASTAPVPNKSAEMGCSIAAVAVGIAWIVVPPGGIGGDNLFKQGAEVVEQRVLPFVHKHGSGGMEGLNNRDAVMDAAFADQLLDRLGKVEKLDFLPGRVIEHPSEYTQGRGRPRTARGDAACRGYSERLGWFFHGIRCPPGRFGALPRQSCGWILLGGSGPQLERAFAFGSCD